MSTDTASTTATIELQHLAAAVADAKTTLEAHRALMNRRVVDAIDLDGLTVPQVARAIGVSKPRIYAIIASECAD